MARGLNRGAVPSVEDRRLASSGIGSIIPLTAEVYGLSSLATVSDVAFLFHQLGGFTSMLMAFSIATVMLCPVAIRAFTIRERRYSVSYLTAPTSAGAAAD